MSLKPSPIEPVPEGTARVAKAAFRRGNPLLSLRDEFGAIFADADFADLFPRLGQPGLPPWRLALVTILQFRENLPDRRAAEALRARIDWKYRNRRLTGTLRARWHRRGQGALGMKKPRRSGAKPCMRNTNRERPYPGPPRGAAQAAALERQDGGAVQLRLGEFLAR